APDGVKPTEEMAGWVLTRAARGRASAGAASGARFRREGKLHDFRLGWGAPTALAMWLDVERISSSPRRPWRTSSGRAGTDPDGWLTWRAIRVSIRCATMSASPRWRVDEIVLSERRLTHAAEDENFHLLATHWSAFRSSTVGRKRSHEHLPLTHREGGREGL